MFNSVFQSFPPLHRIVVDVEPLVPTDFTGVDGVGLRRPALSRHSLETHKLREEPPAEGIVEVLAKSEKGPQRTAQQADKNPK